MPTISARISRGRFVSIELLPPRTTTGEEALAAAVQELAPLNPAFVAVTYGANGSDRGRTEALVEQLAGFEALPLPHLTCAAHRRAELVTLIERYRRVGVENLLALHGDPPLVATEVLPEGELRYAGRSSSRCRATESAPERARPDSGRRIRRGSIGPTPTP